MVHNSLFEMNLIQRIRGLDKLTPSEAKVAAFIEANYPLTAFETISSISEKAGVGKATVGRLLNRLGYQSFSDLMDDARREVVSRLESPIDRYLSRKNTLDDEGADYLGQHIKYTLKNFNETRARMDPGQLKKAAELLAYSEGHLYCMGAATSHALAYFFYLLSMYLRDRVHLLNAEPSTLPHSLIDVSSNDVLLAITHYRFSSQTTKVAHRFAKKKATIILITDREVTPISDIATVQIVASSEGPPLFNSRCGTLLVLESLLTSMAMLLEDQVHRRFETFEQLREEFETYSQWPVFSSTRSLYESRLSIKDK